MVFKDESEVFEFIQKHQSTEKWVSDARKYHKTLKALVTGDDFAEELIQRIEKIESKDRAEARRKYSKPIRDLFDRVMQPRLSIFSASGGSVKNEMPEGQRRDKFIESLKHFKGQKSIKQYLSENFFRLEDTDPNGVIFLEYKEDIDIYPAYKSINDIRYYKSNGQMLDVILFEPKVKKGIGAHEWRVVDDETDWRVLQTNNSFTVIPDKTFKHPFGKVPGVILSDIQELGTEKRISPLFPIEELAKDYARDKSILTIYKFQNGFPRHWRYIKECRPCHGTGKTGEGTCKVCDGKGELRVNDVTDITTIALPREDDQIVTPNIEGFVSPDLATWQRYKEDLIEAEDRIDNTMWGTKRLKEGENETATGRFIDVQPVMNKLGKFTDNVEWVHNKLAWFTENWVNGTPKSKSEYTITYGRRFIIESPDTIMEKYTEAREKGDNSTILDKLLDEYILSRYSNNPDLVEKMQKKRQVEPYVHQSLKEVSETFGAEEAYKKVLFVDFWEQADQSKDVKQLKVDFEEYVRMDSENKQLTDQEKVRKLLGSLSPLLGTAVLKSMTGQQILDLVGLEYDEEFFKQPEQPSNINP